MGAGNSAASPVELDGSEGEGGGQILRSALSLSMITGRPFQIEKIRAKRKPGGLRPAHLACVRGAETVSSSQSEGAEVGSEELSFVPGPVKPGEYVIEVGTAGSTPLLFQCLFYPLALAGGGMLTLRGGTHVPHSPVFHYLSWIWLPAVEAFGLRARLQLRHAGFYPEGAGEWRATVLPREEPPNRVDVPSRGTLGEVEVSSFVAGLPFELAERQAKAAVGALRERGIHSQAESVPLPATRSQGTVVFIRAEFENTAAGFTALGDRGRRSEDVGREAADQLARFMEGGGAIDEHLGDQLLMPAALLAAGLLGPSSPATTLFKPSRITEHLTTHARVLERFLPEVEISVDASGIVQVQRRRSP